MRGALLNKGYASRVKQRYMKRRGQVTVCWGSTDDRDRSLFLRPRPLSSHEALEHRGSVERRGKTGEYLGLESLLAGGEGRGLDAQDAATQRGLRFPPAAGLGVAHLAACWADARRFTVRPSAVHPFRPPSTLYVASVADGLARWISARVACG